MYVPVCYQVSFLHSLSCTPKCILSNMVFCYSTDGNGFKTSTMRLGADAIVFSRCMKSRSSPTSTPFAWWNNLLSLCLTSCWINAKLILVYSEPTQSVGLLSYTFLAATGQKDVVVPVVCYVNCCFLWQSTDGYCVILKWFCWHLLLSLGGLQVQFINRGSYTIWATWRTSLPLKSFSNVKMVPFCNRRRAYEKCKLYVLLVVRSIYR
jgi:hypothetical protein